MVALVTKLPTIARALPGVGKTLGDVAKNAGKFLGGSGGSSSEKAVSEGAKTLGKIGGKGAAKEAAEAGKDFTRSSASSGGFKDLVKDVSSLGKDHSPKAVGKVMTDVFKSQASGAKKDHGIASIVGKGLLTAGITHEAGKFLGHGGDDEAKEKGRDASQAGMNFMQEGRDSMVGGVNQLSNDGNLHMLDRSAWQQMGEMDNGTMSSRMGFNPALMASGAMVGVAGQSMPQMAVPGGTVPYANSGAGALPRDFSPGALVAPLPGTSTAAPGMPQMQGAAQLPQLSKMSGEASKSGVPIAKLPSVMDKQNDGEDHKFLGMNTEGLAKKGAMAAAAVGGYELFKHRKDLGGGMETLEKGAASAADAVGMHGVAGHIKDMFDLNNPDKTYAENKAKDAKDGASKDGAVKAAEAGASGGMAASTVNAVAEAGGDKDHNSSMPPGTTQAAKQAAKSAVKDDSLFSQIGKFGSSAVSEVEGAASSVGSAVADGAGAVTSALPEVAEAAAAVAPEAAELAPLALL